MKRLTAKEKRENEAQAVATLQGILTPGDRVTTVLKKVLRSGMSRQIAVMVCRDGQVSNVSGLVSDALGLRWNDNDSVTVSGCGMDTGFHTVYSLGHVLFGRIAGEGKGKAANAIRRALFKADRFYFMQGGREEEPNPNRPDPEWGHGAGYALKQSWA